MSRKASNVCITRAGSNRMKKLDEAKSLTGSSVPCEEIPVSKRKLNRCTPPFHRWELVFCFLQNRTIYCVV